MKNEIKETKDKFALALMIMLTPFVSATLIIGDLILALVSTIAMLGMFSIYMIK